MPDLGRENGLSLQMHTLNLESPVGAVATPLRLLRSCRTHTPATLCLI